MAKLILPPGIKSSEPEPEMPTRPEEHKLERVYAQNGMVVLAGRIGDKPYSDAITVEEARARAKAIYEVWKMEKIPSDKTRLRQMLDDFEIVIGEARRQNPAPQRRSKIVSMRQKKKD